MERGKGGMEYLVWLAVFAGTDLFPGCGSALRVRHYVSELGNWGEGKERGKEIPGPQSFEMPVLVLTARRRFASFLRRSGFRYSLLGGSLSVRDDRRNHSRS